MGRVPILLTGILGLWWGWVVLSLAQALGLGQPGAGLPALIALIAAALAGHRYVAPGNGAAARASRGFLALGLSFGLGALLLAGVAMQAGENAGAAAAGGANPLGPVFGTVLAPILAGNLVAGLMVVLGGTAAAVCLMVAAVFRLAARRG